MAFAAIYTVYLLVTYSAAKGILRKALGRPDTGN
jgi:CRISPR-associated Cas5-like protein